MTEAPPPTSLAKTWAWAFVPLSIVLLDLHFQWRDERIAFVALNPLSYLFSIAASAFFWSQLPKLRHGKRTGFAALIILTSIMAFLCQTVWQTYRLRRMGFGAGDVIYFIEEPGNTISLAMSASDWLIPVVLLGTFALWIAALSYTTPPPVDRLKTPLALLAVPLCLFASTHVSKAFAPLGADARSVVSIVSGIGHYANGIRSYATGIAKRDAPPSIETGDASPNILLIIGESVRRDRFSVATKLDRETTPFLSTFVESNAEHVTVFNRHVPNSASTFFSLTALLLGHYQAVERETFSSAPVIWQFAKGAGHKTFAVSAQSWAWGGLHDALVAEQPPDWYADIDRFGFPQVNDTGADDLLVADVVAKWIGEHAEDSFTGVVQLNSTHFPFHASDNTPWQIVDEASRYDASVLRTDEAIGRMIQSLEENGILNKTVVVFVSDHAEGLLTNYDDAKEEELRTMEPEYVTGSRSQSCDPLFINAPMLMFVPPAFAQIPKENAERVTSHVDILPTLLTYLGYENREMSGFALQATIPPERAAFCFTSGATSKYQLSGYGVRVGNRYVYERADFSKPRSWDLSSGDVTVRYLTDEFPDEAQRAVDAAASAWPDYVNFVRTQK